jgi:hypothetical protein
LVGGEISFITTLGTTFWGAAVGPALSYVEDSYQSPREKVHSLIQASFGHRAFFSNLGYERLYFTLSATTDLVRRSLVKHGELTLDFRTGAMLGVGYYFPERQYLVRKAL